ncbi:putative Heterokaryon incompatibility domain-containing protein [Seiridium cardinale]
MGIKADYSLSVEQAYREAFLYHLHHYANLYNLASCHTNASLPSSPGWVPDWAKDESERFPIVDDITNASGPLPALAAYMEGGVLSAAGVRWHRSGPSRC